MINNKTCFLPGKQINIFFLDIQSALIIHGTEQNFLLIRCRSVKSADIISGIFKSKIFELFRSHAFHFAGCRKTTDHFLVIINSNILHSLNSFRFRTAARYFRECSYNHFFIKINSRFIETSLQQRYFCGSSGSRTAKEIQPFPRMLHFRKHWNFCGKGFCFFQVKIIPILFGHHFCDTGVDDLGKQNLIIT